MLPTLTEIARAAGVSAATVDRVMNARDGVRVPTRAHVLAVALRLGHPGPPADIAPFATPRPVRIALLLPQGTNAFIRELAEQAHRQATHLPGVTVEVETLAGFDPAVLSARIAALQGKVDGVALVAIDHPLVREALMATIRAGTHVVTLASDIHNLPRLAYVGIDNAQAGRLAGYMVGRFLGKSRPAKVALFAGSLAYRGHQEREMGFRQIMAEEFPRFTIADLREVQESREKAYVETLALLDRQPDLAAIYNAGGATAGIARALKDRGRSADMVFVAHEALAANKALLLDGTLDAVIDQNPRVEVRETLAALVCASRGIPHTLNPPRLQIVFRENLPMA